MTAEQPVRVLQVVLGLEQTGIDNVVMDLYRHMDRRRYQFDFVVFGNRMGAHEPEAKMLGARVWHVPTRSSGWRAADKALRRVIHDQGYPLVHAHQDCMSGQVLKQAKRAGAAVRLAHAHTTSLPDGLRRYVYRWARRSIPRYANGFVACTERAGRWMFGRRTVEAGRCFVLSNAVDPERFRFDAGRRDHCRRALGLTPDQTVVIHTGRLAYAKNHAFLLSVFAAFRSLDPDAVLLSAGAGELEAALKAETARLKLEDAVRWLGARDDVPDLLCAADILVMPSRFEGLPLSCIEAQISGMPALIADTIDPVVCYTDRIRQLPLTAAPAVWAKTMQALLRLRPDREYDPAAVRQAGFEIQTQAAALAGYYDKALKQPLDPDGPAAADGGVLI